MIPKKIHFIYGLKPDFGGIPFNFCHWVAVKSAAKLNPDYEIHFWYEFEPDTKYFNDLKNQMILHKITAPKEIFGNPIPHFAHRADVLRLQILLEHGGVYLDMDTITVKPYDFFLDKKVVMSVVKNSGNVYGLCNAVMMGEQNAVFFSEWLKAFKGFRSQGYDQFYDEFACNYPYVLATQIPNEITVYDETLFFVPDMTNDGLYKLFNDPNSCNPNAFCHHLWEKNSQELLKNMNESNYDHLKGLYSRHLKEILALDVYNFIVNAI